MKHHNTLTTIIFGAVFLFFLAACDTGSDNTETDQGEEASSKSEKFVRNASDGLNEYSERDLDSLRFTYNFAMENAIHILTKNDRSAVNVLPVEPWEKLLTRSGIFYNPEDIQYNNCKVHRKDYVKLNTSGRPIEMKDGTNGKNVFIPIDGNTASGIKALKAKHPNAKLVLVADDAPTVVFEGWENITAEGVRVKDLKPEQAEFIRNAFTLVEEEN